MHRAKAMRSLVTCLTNQSFCLQQPLLLRNNIAREAIKRREKSPTGVFDGERPSCGRRVSESQEIQCDTAQVAHL